MSFSKMKSRKVEKFLPEGWHQWEGNRHKERVKSEE
jgi:hypothetical protein